jgi:glycine dehydrogenase subunit 2
LTRFHQANWYEPLIFEIGHADRKGFQLPFLDKPSKLGLDLKKLIPKELLRMDPPNLPELSEGATVRHYTRLSQLNFSVDTGFYPLGSCTMKYNPKINDAVVNSNKVHFIHPFQEETTVQGALEIMYNLANWLSEITGMHRFTLQPSAGAHGEFIGTLIMRAYHQEREELETRTEIIIPDSAHGTNLASAAMSGFKVIVVPSNEKGCVNLEALESVVSDKTCGLMLTNPNTLGLFEENIIEISQIIHDVGGLLYYDGANLNAIIGKVTPGDMGFDIVHLNLHKTFSTPHGGGGPGSGPVGVVEELEPFLPIPRVAFTGQSFYLDYHHPQSIGSVGGFYGNFEIIVRAFTYIISMGSSGLKKVAEFSVLNANYLAHQISEIKGFTLPFGKERLRKHEFVISCSKLKQDTGLTAKHVAKRMLDYGIHAPTIYFPPIVDEALMIEPTETESIEDLNRYVDVFTQISKEAYTNPKLILEAPHNTSIKALDEVKASHPRTMCLSWRMYKKSQQKSQFK